jgi:hypothetical protein
MRKLFTNHSHSHEEDTPPAPASSASTAEVVDSKPEEGAVTPAIAEKPPVETASHLEEKQRANSGYFRRAHRLKVKAKHGAGK